MKNIILIAPPAAGKGTISNYLEEILGYTHISTGDILRSVSKEDTLIGNQVKSLIQEGKFISDEIILPLFKEKLLSLKEKAFILDGIPRTLDQAKYLQKLFQEINVDNYAVIHMDIEEAVLEKRVVGRRICECGATYNIYFDGFKPKVEGLCDKCSKDLKQRDDDTLETYKKRYQTYKVETEPILQFYKEENVLKVVDATLPKEEIIKNIVEVIND